MARKKQIVWQDHPHCAMRRIYPGIDFDKVGWRWWRSKDRRYVHVYTTTRDINGFFYAVEMKYEVSKETFRDIRSSNKKSRWRTKDQAWKWVCKRDGRTFKSLHEVSDKKREAGKRLRAGREENLRKRAENKKAQTVEDFLTAMSGKRG
jgi:hypothetical protein